MRRARFPVELFEDETIPGALARSIRLNVLDRSAIAMSDAGLQHRATALTQLMSGEELTALSEFMGCNPSDMIQQAGIVEGRALSFGGLSLLRTDVELVRRRIAPGTLSKEPFHRGAWLIRLLPYCPVSLERLVDTCPACGTALAWTRCWGIGVCEWCRTPITASPELPLTEKLADDYRLFAGLLSPCEDTRRKAIETLPRGLHDIAAGALITMAVRFGQICRVVPVKDVCRAGITKLAPELLADVVATGAAILRGWPGTFIEWGTGSLRMRIDDLPGYHAIRANIRRLGNGRFEDADQAALVREALPSEFDSFARSAPVSDFMTGLELRTIAHLRPEQLRLLRPGLEDRRLPSIERQRSQYNPKKAREFGTKYRESKKLTGLTFALLLPIYAIEQMICEDVLDEQQDSLVRLARGATCVTGSALDELVRQIRGREAKSDRPESAVPVAVAARRIGGREKPWSAIFRALLKGQLPFWLTGEKVSARTIFVLPASLAKFEEVSFRRGDHPDFHFTDSVAKFEAQELLNLAPKNLAPLIDGGHLAFRREGLRMIADLADVLDLATRMVAFAELASHTGWSYWRACDETDALGVGRVGNGWCRADLLRHNLLPAASGPVIATPAPLSPMRYKIHGNQCHSFESGNSHV